MEVSCRCNVLSSCPKFNFHTYLDFLPAVVSGVRFGKFASVGVKGLPRRKTAWALEEAQKSRPRKRTNLEANLGWLGTFMVLIINGCFYNSHNCLSKATTISVPTVKLFPFLVIADPAP